MLKLRRFRFAKISGMVHLLIFDEKLTNINVNVRYLILIYQL